MKAKKFKLTPAPSLTGKLPYDTFTRRQVVALIAARVRTTDIDEKTARNRVSAQITYDVSKGKLPCAKRGAFLVGDIGVWSRAKWPGSRFSDIPIFPNKGTAKAMLPAVHVEASGHLQPTTLPEAIAEIRALRRSIASLTRALAATEAQVRDLETDAASWRSWNNKKRRPREA